MELIELAVKLGEALRDDERIIKLRAAKAAYAADSELCDNMNEYESQKMALAAIDASDKETEEGKAAADEIEKRLTDLYYAITENANFTALDEMQAEANEIIEMINKVLSAGMAGEEDLTAAATRPSHHHCGHNCSSCGGCGSDNDGDDDCGDDE